MAQLRIAAVSYLNTIPFVYGIKNSGFLENCILELCYPSKCAEKLFSDHYDVSLVPVGALVNKDNINIISNYCIGAYGSVGSVFILSNCPINEIKEIHLDSHSITSILLAKIIAKKYWKIQVSWNETKIDLTENKNLKTIVAIGDKTFEMQKNYQYKFDLADEWFKYTKLPFVFACWVSLYPITNELQINLNKAFEYGLIHKKEAIDEYYPSGIENIDPLDYLENKISFSFDHAKKIALDKFFELAKDFK